MTHIENSPSGGRRKTLISKIIGQLVIWIVGVGGGFLLTIAVSNTSCFKTVVETGRASNCSDHLHQIETAKGRWLMDHSKLTSKDPTRADLEPKYILWPKCGSGGAYSIGSTDKDPTCSVHGKSKRKG
ncbi:MAG: hypothetical protein Q7K33_01395 [Candidatus Berkelbacteria bacterium]|nr:hypothetical protein [Candidatus Berkelbacteria bacterium]